MVHGGFASAAGPIRSVAASPSGRWARAYLIFWALAVGGEVSGLAPLAGPSFARLPFARTDPHAAHADRADRDHLRPGLAGSGSIAPVTDSNWRVVRRILRGAPRYRHSSVDRADAGHSCWRPFFGLCGRDPVRGLHPDLGERDDQGPRLCRRGPRHRRTLESQPGVAGRAAVWVSEAATLRLQATGLTLSPYLIGCLPYLVCLACVVIVSLRESPSGECRPNWPRFSGAALSAPLHAPPRIHDRPPRGQLVSGGATNLKNKFAQLSLGIACRNR